LGWISKEDIKHHERIFKTLFPRDLKPKNIINVSPSFEWVKESSKRDKKQKKKWREDNFEYLKKVIDAFPEFNSKINNQVNILELKETDPFKRGKIILKWVKFLC